MILSSECLKQKMRCQSLLVDHISGQLLITKDSKLKSLFSKSHLGKDSNKSQPLWKTIYFFPKFSKTFFNCFKIIYKF